MTVLIDFTQLSYRCYYVGMDNNDLNWNYWRYLILQSIQKLIKLFHPNEIVLCCDDKNCWRKKRYKYYKANRKYTKDVVQGLWVEHDNFIDELKNIFPYKVIKIEGAEADDIIAILSVFYKKENDFSYIISTDKDFIQLLRYDNVMLYNPIKDIFVGEKWPYEIKKGEIFESPMEYLQYHIMRAGDDGISNILSDEDVFITEGKRQKPLGYKKFMKIKNYGFKKWFDEQSEKVKKKFETNKELIILNDKYIPVDIQKKIKKEYNKIVKKYDKDLIFNYLKSKEMESLYDFVEIFNLEV